MYQALLPPPLCGGHKPACETIQAYSKVGSAIRFYQCPPTWCRYSLGDNPISRQNVCAGCWVYEIFTAYAISKFSCHGAGCVAYSAAGHHWWWIAAHPL